MFCMWIPVVTMGYSIESLDVCFGNQLADSRDLGVIQANGLVHVFIFFSPIETLGYSLKFFVWIEYYESEVVDAY